MKVDTLFIKQNVLEQCASSNVQDTETDLSAKVACNSEVFQQWLIS